MLIDNKEAASSAWARGYERWMSPRAYGYPHTKGEASRPWLSLTCASICCCSRDTARACLCTMSLLDCSSSLLASTLNWVESCSKCRLRCKSVRALNIGRLLRTRRLPRTSKTAKWGKVRKNGTLFWGGGPLPILL